MRDVLVLDWKNNWGMGGDFAFINWMLNLLIRLNPIVPDSSVNESVDTGAVALLGSLSRRVAMSWMRRRREEKANAGALELSSHVGSQRLSSSLLPAPWDHEYLCESFFISFTFLIM